MGKSPPLKTAGSLAPGKVYSKTIVFFFFRSQQNHTKPDLQAFFSRNTGLPRRNLTHDNFRFQVGFCVCVFFSLPGSCVFFTSPTGARAR